MPEPFLHQPDDHVFWPLQRTRQSAEDRITFNECTHAIGEIVLSFADLENAITLGIERLQGSVNADMSFERKADLLATLARQRNASECLGLEHVIDLLVAQWHEAKVLRDRVLRLSDGPLLGNLSASNQTTSGADDDVIPNEEFDASYLMDIAHFIASMAGGVETFVLAEA